MGRREGVYYYYEVLTPLREKVIEYLSSPMMTIKALIWVIFILITLRLIVDIFIHTKFVKNILRNKSLISYIYKLKYRLQGKSALKLDELTDVELKEKLEILLECREQNLTFHYTSRKKCDNLKEIVDLISNCRLRQLEEDLKKRSKAAKKVENKVNKTKEGKKAKESKDSESHAESDVESNGKESNHSKKKNTKNKKDDDKESSSSNNNEDESDSKEKEKGDDNDDQDKENEDKSKRKKKAKKKDKKKEEEDDEEESNDDKSDPNINPSILLDITQDVIDDELKDIYSFKDLVTCKSEDDFFKEDVFEKSKKDMIVDLLNKSIKNRKSATQKRRNHGDKKEGDLLIPDSTQSERDKDNDGNTEDEVSLISNNSGVYIKFFIYLKYNFAGFNILLEAQVLRFVVTLYWIIIQTYFDIS
uniref:Exported protein n=1 Tax=Strongyloides venezuelensis TaxID=75913 RepID=A0A0K0EWB8_STRVS